MKLSGTSETLVPSTTSQKTRAFIISIQICTILCTSRLHVVRRRGMAANAFPFCVNKTVQSILGPQAGYSEIYMVFLSPKGQSDTVMS